MFTTHRRASARGPLGSHPSVVVAWMQGPDGELVALKLHRLGHGHSVTAVGPRP